MTTKIPAHRRLPAWDRFVTAWRKAPRAALVAVGVGLAGVVALVVLGIFDREDAVESEQETAQTQETLDRIADPLAALCSADQSVRARLGDDVCFTAQRVVDMIPSEPIPGAEGDRGADGRGIVATVIRADGHLVVSYSDGARIDVGPVVGEAGVNGRGIVTSQITDGRLELVFTDNSVQDLGPVVGARGDAGVDGTDGRGITSTAIVEGRLIVTYSDSTTEDAGPVPPGPSGQDGSPAASQTFTTESGVIYDCPRSGGPDTAPIYACSVRP